MKNFSLTLSVLMITAVSPVKSFASDAANAKAPPPWSCWVDCNSDDSAQIDLQKPKVKIPNPTKYVHSFDGTEKNVTGAYDQAPVKVDVPGKCVGQGPDAKSAVNAILHQPGSFGASACCTTSQIQAHGWCAAQPDGVKKPFITVFAQNYPAPFHTPVPPGEGAKTTATGQ
jgi:hypothetical protein